MKKLLLVLSVLAVISLGYGTMSFISAKNPSERLSVAMPWHPKVDCNYNESELLELINKEREKVGVHPITIDPGLDKISEDRAVTLNGKMDNHIGFRKLLSSYAYDTKFVSIAENLVGDETFTCHSVKGYVGSWMQSTKGHRETMLDPRYDLIGIGFYNGVSVTQYGDLKSS